tara:strand:+ start:1810 stop:3447 length:1638 start_codon:yes stop_codon:yes gene_type:complete
MIKIVLSSFLVTALYTPFGIYFEKGKTSTSFSLQLIYGLIVISFFALLFNFFFSLNQIFNTVFLVVGLALLIKHRKIYLNKNYFVFCLISSLLIFLLITNSHVYRPDAGLYHLPYISILNHEKIILGISNLHFRFGHISIVQYLSAVSNNLVFGINGIVFPVALIGVAVIVNFLANIYLKFLRNEFDFHFLFIFSIMVFIFYKMNRYSEYGNDAPAHFLLFLLVSELIKNFRNIQKDNISNYFLIAMFIVMNKIILITSIIFPLIYFLKGKFTFKYISKKNFFISFFVFLWIAKNILTSGCALYPLKVTCVNNLKWTNLEKAEKVSIENEAWAKGWPDFRKKEIDIKQKDYSKKFYWLNTWLQNHFIIILKILTPYILLLILFSVLIEKEKKYIQEKIFIKVLIALSFVGLVIWFIKVPAFRYGYSYIIILIALLFASYGRKFIFHKTSKSIFKITIAILLTIFTFKNLNRILLNNDIYFNYPWPRFYSYEKNNNITKNKFQIINGKKIYEPSERYCMFSNAPCGPNNKLKIMKSNNYLIFLPSF